MLYSSKVLILEDH